MAEQLDLFHIEMGKYIRQKRENAGLTIAQLAGYADCDDKNLGRIELGQRSPHFVTLFKVFDYLDIDMGDFQKALKPYRNEIKPYRDYLQK
ncbi:hypothetical protein GCM10009001_36080 [Virgibacillus siamensis]|uniref:HTH cro/C1-type domain-containing protein n=1 Tax=Virgibacillus siamensis TaxID=480071 RepID=A0ABN1GP84_9BACI